MKGGPKHIKCSEDEDFMTAFDKMMTENIQVGLMYIMWLYVHFVILPQNELTPINGIVYMYCTCSAIFVQYSVNKSMSFFNQARTNESLKVPQLDIAVPMNLKDKNKKTGQDETSQNKLNRNLTCCRFRSGSCLFVLHMASVCL